MSHPGEMLSAFLDGELRGSQRSEVRAHLEGCAPCRDELAAVETARSAVRSLPVLDVPPGIVPASSPAAQSWLRRRVVAVAGSAAAVVLAMTGLAAINRPGPAFEMGTLSDQHTARVVVDPGISTIRAPGGAP